MAENIIIKTKKIGVNFDIAPFAIVYEDSVIGDHVRLGEYSVVGRSLAPTKAMVREESINDCVVISDEVSISAHVVIYQGVKIGRDSLIGDHTSILSNVEIGESVLISRHVTINSDVVIGNNSRVMDNTHITGRVKIGKHVFISVGVNMANDNLFGRNGFTEEVKGPTIEDYVSIGVGSTILPNITIGRGSIIVAGTIVKDNVPENVIYGGNPAKVISRVPRFMKRDREED